MVTIRILQKQAFQLIERLRRDYHDQPRQRARRKRLLHLLTATTARRLDNRTSPIVRPTTLRIVRLNGTASPLLTVAAQHRCPHFLRATIQSPLLLWFPVTTLLLNYRMTASVLLR